MKHLWENVAQSRHGAYAASSAELITTLVEDLRAGDSVVIKGSFGSKMGPVADALRQKFSTFQKEGH